VPLAADLEMHGAKKGYVGFCRLQEGEVNVCGLFRRPVRGHEDSAPWRELLKGQHNTPLWQRMDGADIDDASFCAVAGLSLRPRRATSQGKCVIGDALTMIPPVTGNGMSMAFEAAEMAIPPLARYSRGEIAWEQARLAIARACDDAFAQRLAWAQWLQWMMFTPALRTGLGALVLNSDWLWRTMFARTR